MTGRALGRRLRHLEARAHPARVICMWRYDDEGDDDAERRWLSENPDARLSAHDLRVVIVRFDERG